MSASHCATAFRASFMHPLRILGAASAMEISAAAALLALLGLGGWRSGWLDVINSFAPMILILGLAGGGLAVASLDHGGTRVVTLGLAAIAVAYGAFVIAPEYLRWRPAPRSGPAAYRVLSANVWSLNPSPYAAVAEILARDPDAVLLQESDGSIAFALPRLRARYPYASVCLGTGVEILVKTPIIAQGCGLGSKTRAELEFAWIRTTAPDGKPVTLVTTHFSHPFPPGYQEADRVALATRLKPLPNDEVILAGDFNSTPWSFALKRQDQMLRPLTRRSIGWFSWPARLDRFRRPWSLPILPIDHVYAGRNWTSTRFTRVRMPGSDHFATEVEFHRATL